MYFHIDLISFRNKFESQLTLTRILQQLIICFHLTCGSSSNIKLTLWNWAGLSERGRRGLGKFVWPTKLQSKLNSIFGNNLSQHGGEANNVAAREGGSVGVVRIVQWACIHVQHVRHVAGHLAHLTTVTIIDQRHAQCPLKWGNASLASFA